VAWAPRAAARAACRSAQGAKQQRSPRSARAPRRASSTPAGPLSRRPRPPPPPRRRCRPAQVTLIDQGERFVFKPLLYELLNGTASAEEVAPTFAQLLAPYPVEFVRVRARGVG
jgi:hypothetical protein